MILPVSPWVATTSYTYNITTAVQEVINLASWVSGHTLGVILVGTSQTTGWRYADSYGTASPPHLDITYT